MVSLGSVAAPIRARTQDRAIAGWLWPQVLGTLVHLAGFGLVALVLHEFFHFVTLQALGGTGYITFDWDMGRTHIASLPNHLWAVRLSGGLFTGLFLLSVFWFWSRSPGTRGYSALEGPSFAWALGNLTYAPAELAGWPPGAAAAAFGIGFGVGLTPYFISLIKSVAARR